MQNIEKLLPDRICLEGNTVPFSPECLVGLAQEAAQIAHNIIERDALNERKKTTARTSQMLTLRSIIS